MDSKLLDACVVLLGPQARRAGQALLAQLTVAMVKSAFRRLALRTHPDASGSPQSSARFIEAAHAYEVLMAFLVSRPRPGATAAASQPGPQPGPKAGPKAGPRPGAQWTPPGGARAEGRSARTGERRQRDLFYHGPLPRRRLRLAEFLYYSGRISWQTLIAALVWQRSSRPKFLEIARQLRIVELQDMSRVLRSRAVHEHTGETASRLQIITTDDVGRILRIQRARQRPIGRYFVENTPVTQTDLEEALREMHRHNARCRMDAERNRRKARVMSGEATA